MAKRLIVVTATTDFDKAAPRIYSWGSAVPVVVVLNGVHAAIPADPPRNLTFVPVDSYLGTVPAFRVGVDHVLTQLRADRDGQDVVIACLHDDLVIKELEWDRRVLRFFDKTPHAGLAGFGGAIGLGADDLYQTPYRPDQLARIGFRSNLDDAEVHGIRSLLTEPVACLDGFSQIGRAMFFAGLHRPSDDPQEPVGVSTPPWTKLEQLGVVHHAYDGMLGCLAARYGWSTFYLPVRAWHLGGQTAVGDAGYQAWAKDKISGGDAGFWEQAHRIWYDEFRDVLPLRV